MNYDTTQLLSSTITEQKLGKLKLNTVYNRDALEGLKEIPSETCQVIIADPPYFRAIKDEWDNQWDTLEDYLAWSDKWINGLNK